MRTIIFGGGEIKEPARIREYIKPDDYIICADRGYDYALKSGIKPDLLLGDFDSVKSELPNDVKILKFPARKDAADGQLAIETAESMGSDEIILFGFIGDRADHTLANIMLLSEHPKAVMIDNNNEIRALTSELILSGRKGQTVSIIPVCGNLEGVSTEGLEYPLNNETLYIGDSRGVSNVMLGDTCVIRRKKGTGLVIKPERV